MGGSYNEFKENIRREHSKRGRQTSLTRSQALNVLWTGLDPNASKTYRDCLQTVLFTLQGVHMAVRNATATDVTVILRYNRGPDQKEELTVTWEDNLKSLSRLPNTLRHGVQRIVRFERPRQQETLVVGTEYGDDDVVLEPLPRTPVVRPASCPRPGGTLNFDGDACKDPFSVVGQEMTINYGNGQVRKIPAGIATYRADLGRWIEGDFNGDGLDDLAHLAIHIPGFPPRLHVHFARKDGTFEGPTTHIFGTYDANAGNWQTFARRGGEGLDLVHNPHNPDNRRHVWTFDPSLQGQFRMYTKIGDT